MNRDIILTVIVLIFLSTLFSSALIYASFNKAPESYSKSVVASSSNIWVLAQERDTIFVRAAKTWTVDDDGPADFSTIQDAINAAGDGDTIQVASGIYYEHVVVDKALSLVGENEHDTIIDGNGIGIVVNVKTTNNVTLSGFTIQKGEIGIYIWESSNNILTGNTASNNSYGICLRGSNTNTFTDNTVSNNWYGIYLWGSTNNTFTGNAASNNWYGIYLWGSTNNIFTGNAASNNSHGIYLQGSSNNIFTSNTASNNMDGIYIWESSNNILTGNTLFSNNDDGIILYHSTRNVLSGNDASNNQYGIHVGDADNNVLSANHASNNQYGIYLHYSRDNILTGNTASNNSYGIYLRGSSHNKIFHNNFINNIQPPSSINSVNSWDNAAEGNYWSDYHGTDANWDGVGDTPYSIDENNQDNYPLMTMLLQFNIATEGRSYKIDVVCNSTISNFQCRYDVHNKINAVSFKVNGTEGKGFCRICIPHALIEPPYKVTVDNNLPLHSKKVYTNGTHTWLYFTYEHSEHEVIIMHKSSLELVFLSQWAILGLMVTVVILLSVSIHYYRLFREQGKVIQAYERELGSFPVSHSERARTRFIKDVIERGEKIEKFKKKYDIKIQPASTLEVLMEKLGVQKEKEKAKH